MMNSLFSAKLRSKLTAFLAATFLVSAGANAAINIDQQPLLVAKPVPGNMAIIGSFEFPTMVTRAYNTTNYVQSADYVGYFNSDRCYEYIYHKDEPQRHFAPTNKTGRECPNNQNYWSGNFLNWASMQSIDIFRHVLTGGHRSVDTTDETFLEKGVQTGQGSSSNNFKDGILDNAGIIVGATPIKPATWEHPEWSSFYSRIGQESHAMKSTLKFSQQKNLSTKNPTPYNPSEHNLHNTRTKILQIAVYDNTVYEVSIRVKVCVKDRLESNCELYPSKKHKPTGLIQQYADQMRFSAFGYLNDNSSGGTYGTNRNRQGGIMHARMKYVGPSSVTDQNLVVPNLKAEWNSETGVFLKNPDTEDAADTKDSKNKPMEHSGVISYINRSGHIVDGTEFKRYDNVSELYYTAYRYLKGLKNIPAYTNNLGSGGARDRLIGGLPVITNWTKEDPIQFTCQKNFFLGIGDTNTHNDRGIIKDGYTDREQADKDPVFSGTFDTLRSVIHAREGMGDGSVTGSVLGSDYIAVLAYDANTNDLRPDMPGKQRASTYWIDILENGLKARKNNAYWLTAKYGGLKVPDSFDPTKSLTPLLDSLWWTTNDKLSNGDKRPDNFYVVDKAQDMIDGLTQAFANIQLEQRGSRASLALNSSPVNMGSKAFQAQYVSGSWNGNLYAYAIDQTTGNLSDAPIWNAEANLPKWNERKVYVNDSGDLEDFKEEGDDQKGFDDDDGEDKVEYLLGNRTKENTKFRVRQGVLGDIVNSQPVFVGNPNPNLFSGRSFTGADSYNTWAKGITRTPMVYIGGNDGMLHGFNADTGVEVFAFIPETVIKNGLSKIADKDYEHRYFVDGELTIAEAYIDKSWTTVLVGTLGAGGIDKDGKTSNAIFALDVTNPNKVKLLWEKSSDDIKELGINLGKPIIIQALDNSEKKQWKVVLGNGPNSKKDTANLISIDLEKGKDTTVEVSKTENNGLSAIRAWDNSGDGLTDTLYAGDLQGAVWEIAINPKNGKYNDPKLLFTAKNSKGEAQPITTAPLAGISPASVSPDHDITWLFFGTGQYLNTADLASKQVQSWYGIKVKDKDKNSYPDAYLRNDLIQRHILKETAVVTKGGANIARVIEQGQHNDLREKQGWYIDLVVGKDNPVAAGERIVTPNQFRGNALIGNTRIPDASDPCAPSGLGMLMSIDPFTGGRLENSFFDINADGTINNSDMVTVDGVATVVSGLGFTSGLSNPVFIGNKIYVSTDDATLNSPTGEYESGSGSTEDSERTSWRELMNPED